MGPVIPFLRRSSVPIALGAVAAAVQGVVPLGPCAAVLFLGAIGQRLRSAASVSPAGVRMAAPGEAPLGPLQIAPVSPRNAQRRPTEYAG
jgi:hypothetical protein